MLEIFTTSKYDNQIAIINENNIVTFCDLKKNIAGEIVKLKHKKQNIVILNDNNYNFIVQFFASIFCGKNIYLISGKKRLYDMDIDYETASSELGQGIDNFEFPNINPHDTVINFYTSGSSGRAKVIKKSLYNLIKEGNDLGTELGIKNKDYTVMSTTTMCHLFGLTFHLMFPLCNGLKIYTETISQPEHVKLNNNILVSTPAFLNCIKKYNAVFEVMPEYIISAGSKLNEDVFKYLEKNSKIAEIYGSTETGIIACKTHFNEPFKLFKNVEINVKTDNVEVISDYAYAGKAVINDCVEINNRELQIKNRTDRLLKINEKRISADEMEIRLRNNAFVEDCYITKHNNKLVCLCALTDLGRNYLLQNDIVKLTKKLKQYLLNIAESVPQRWKFIDIIPMTQQGKINKDVIEHIFDVNLSLPIILKRFIYENAIIYRIFFYNQCNFFNGHFPKFKLVPGVVQLYIAKEFANAHFNLTLDEGQWKRIKFSNIIEPDTVVSLKLEKKDRKVYYEYYSDTKKYSSGIFLCDNIFEEL